MSARFAHIPCRHILLPDGSISWAWPGGYAESIFHGTDLSLSMQGKDCQVRVSIDHTPWEDLCLGEEKQDLHWHGSSGEHLLRIQTTHQESDRRFILHPPVATAVIPAHARPLQIEFVGDSWTCGFGNLSEKELASDCTKAFSALVAEQLHADYSLIAVSGHGIVKNFGEAPPSPESLPVKYLRAESHRSESFSFEERKADIGILLAGENDYSFTPYPDAGQFRQTYRGLLQLMRARHPGIQIFLAGVERNHPCKQMEYACYEDEIKAGKKDLFWIDIPDLDSTLPLGFLWHPGLEHHRRLATYITQAILAKELQ